MKSRVSPRRGQPMVPEGIFHPLRSSFLVDLHPCLYRAIMIIIDTIPSSTVPCTKHASTHDDLSINPLSYKLDLSFPLSLLIVLGVQQSSYICFYKWSSLKPWSMLLFTGGCFKGIIRSDGCPLLSLSLYLYLGHFNFLNLKKNWGAMSMIVRWAQWVGARLEQRSCWPRAFMWSPFNKSKRSLSIGIRRLLLSLFYFISSSRFCYRVLGFFS